MYLLFHQVLHEQIMHYVPCPLQVKKLVYVYLVRYAEEQQDLALLSISTFQRALKVKLTTNAGATFSNCCCALISEENFALSCVSGSEPVDTRERPARSVQYPSDDDRSYHDVGDQRSCDGHVAVRPQNCCSCHSKTVQV